MQDIAMNDIPFSGADLYSQLSEEVNALRAILSLLSEEEQAILANRRMASSANFREAKKNWQSLRKKRFNSIGSVIGCSDLSMLDVLFEKWIIDFDTEFDLSAVWEQIAILMKKIKEQEIRNQSLILPEKAKCNNPRKKQRKLDIMDA